MNNIETMKLALEALETNNKAWKSLADSGDAGWWEAEEQPFYEISVKAITALRQAIEQAQKQERALDCTRVACMGNGGCVGSCWNNDTSQERVDETAKQRHEPCGLECDCTDVCKQNNYKALWQQMCERCDALDKQLAQQAEPVAFINVEKRTLEWAKYMSWNTPTVVNLPKIPLYTSPPSRQPLSDEEKQAMWARTKVYLTPKRSYFQGIADSEAAHGIKGEA